MKIRAQVSDTYFTRYLHTMPLTLSLMMLSMCSFGQPDFSRLPHSTDSSYGYSITNPLKMKKGNPGKSIGYSYDFLSGLVTPDQKGLRFVKRHTVDNPESRKADATLDKYVFLTQENRDTVIIYVDIHSKGKLLIPMGLTYR